MPNPLNEKVCIDRIAQTEVITNSIEVAISHTKSFENQGYLLHSFQIQFNFNPDAICI